MQIRLAGALLGTVSMVMAAANGGCSGSDAEVEHAGPGTAGKGNGGRAGATSGAGVAGGVGGDNRAGDANSSVGAAGSPFQGEGGTGTGGAPSASGGVPNSAGGGTSGGSSSRAGNAGNGGSAGSGAKPLRVAFFGDQGNNSNSELALHLVREQKADFLIVLGDFDYDDNPRAWQELMDRGLGEDFPWLAVGGNHDEKKWLEYVAIIKKKAASIAGLDCTGTPGNMASCTYRGVHFVTTGISLTALGKNADQENFLEQNLKGSKATWKICNWHKNEEDMNTGWKGIWPVDTTFVGWRSYQSCAKYGAFVMNGHEHAYSRTLTLGCIGDDPKDHCPEGRFHEVKLGNKRTFVTVSGLGGREIRDFNSTAHGDDILWASYYTANREMSLGVVKESATNSNAGVGALFIDFGVDDNPQKAHAFYMIAQNGRIIDDYVIYAE